MELRYKEAERARAIFERYVRCLPSVKAWVRFAKFEAQSGEFSRARACYERAVEELGEDGQTVRRLFWLDAVPNPPANLLLQHLALTVALHGLERRS